MGDKLKEQPRTPTLIARTSGVQGICWEGFGVQEASLASQQICEREIFLVLLYNLYMFCWLCQLEVTRLQSLLLQNSPKDFSSGYNHVSEIWCSCLGPRVLGMGTGHQHSCPGRYRMISSHILKVVIFTNAHVSWVQKVTEQLDYYENDMYHVHGNHISNKIRDFGLTWAL